MERFKEIKDEKKEMQDRYLMHISEIDGYTT